MGTEGFINVNFWTALFTLLNFLLELLENAKPQLVHNQFAATKPLPAGGGKTVEWRKFGSFDKALTPLTEGVTS